MPPPKSKNNPGLGRAIINQKVKDAQRAHERGEHTTDYEANNRLNSVTQERDLDEFLNTAQLAGTEFVAEKQNIKIIQAPSATSSSAHNPFLLTTDEERQALQRHRENKSRLRVPRRPAWLKSTPHPLLERREKDAFLEWRRGLAELQETENFLLTPFERNLEVWRQLWRVLERSHLVVQIVDARNPLRFRCEDLEAYVQDIEGPEGEKGTGKRLRKSLLLINKADLLTAEQRRLWADYFDEQNVKYAFFSAANATALQEAARKEAEAAEQPLDGVPPEDEEDEDEVDTDEDAELGEDLEIENQLAADLATAARLHDKGEGSADDGSSQDGAERRGLNMDDEADGDPRTRVLNVTELEELFIREAPDLQLFAAPGSPPPKLVVGLVGYPNVGKSSTINSLIGAKKVSVSSTPGKTKHFQTIHLSPSLVLCDCPGLVFPQFATSKAELVCDGVLPIDQMREHTAPVALVAQRIPREILEATYGLAISRTGEDEGLPMKMTAEDLLIPYAIARGFARAGKGEPDEARAARYILKDFVGAKLLFSHPPPGIDADEFNAPAREKILRRLQAEGKKKAPTTRVGKGADNFIGSAPASTASSAAPRSGKANALDNAFFNNFGLGSRPFVRGSALNGQEFSRAKLYPHQNVVADDGTPLGGRAARIASVLAAQGESAGKKHHKAPKRQKQRSGKGYD